MVERVGTRCYMAPEVFQQKAYTLSADVYAVGRRVLAAASRVQMLNSRGCICSIFYELLSLQKPEDVNPRTTFDWTRVPNEYDPCIIQVTTSPGFNFKRYHTP